MTVSAEKIVEEPIVEITSGTKVVGEAPPPPRAAAAPAPTPAAAPVAEPAPAPAAAPAAEPAPAPAKKLPKTGSPVPLMGLLGLLFLGGSYGLRLIRRS